MMNAKNFYQKYSKRYYIEYTDCDGAPFSTAQAIEPNGYSLQYLDKKPLTTCHKNHWVTAEVSFEGEPRISPMGELSFEVRLCNETYNLYQLAIRTMTPDGWSAQYPKATSLQHRTGARDIDYVWHELTGSQKTFEVKLTANENTSAINRIYIAVEADGYPEPLVIPVTILG